LKVKCIRGAQLSVGGGEIWVWHCCYCGECRSEGRIEETEKCLKKIINLKKHANMMVVVSLCNCSHFCLFDDH
jgi:hypothetical protein